MNAISSWLRHWAKSLCKYVEKNDLGLKLMMRKLRKSNDPKALKIFIYYFYKKVLTKICIKQHIIKYRCRFYIKHYPGILILLKTLDLYFQTFMNSKELLKIKFACILLRISYYYVIFNIILKVKFNTQFEEKTIITKLKCILWHLNTTKWYHKIFLKN